VQTPAEGSTTNDNTPAYSGTVEAGSTVVISVDGVVVGNATVTMRKVLEEEPLPPSRFNMQITGAMDAVVRRALAKKADERFQTAEEFVQDVLPVREHVGRDAAAVLGTVVPGVTANPVLVPL